MSEMSETKEAGEDGFDDPDLEYSQAEDEFLHRVAVVRGGGEGDLDALRTECSALGVSPNNINVRFLFAK